MESEKIINATGLSEKCEAAIRPVNDLDLINSAIKDLERNTKSMEHQVCEMHKRVEQLQSLRSCIMNNIPLTQDARDAVKGMLFSVLR